MELSDSIPTTCEPLQCDWLQERFAIMEHDGGLAGRRLENAGIKDSCAQCDLRGKQTAMRIASRLHPDEY